MLKLNVYFFAKKPMVIEFFEKVAKSGRKWQKKTAKWQDVAERDQKWQNFN